MKNRVFEYNWRLYKKCKNCGCTKEITKFHSNWFSKKWTKIYKSSCQYCSNIINRNKRIIKKRKL